MSTALKERHRKFVEAYLSNGGSGVEAARSAGYSGEGPQLAVRASELLARDDVKAAIAERVENDPAVAGRVEIQQKWTKLMRADGLKVAVKEQLEASKLLARSHGMFVEKHEIAHTGTVVITLPDNGRGDGPARDDD